MLGAVIGDIVGSIYEFSNIKTKEFNFFSPACFFTDDTVMTFAIFDALTKCRGDYSNLEKNVVKQMQKYGKKYPNKTYGYNFYLWLQSSNPRPYNSYGNGSAMRVSSVAYFAKSIDEVKLLARLTASPTHNHEEGMKGAEATAVAMWLALQDESKADIKKYIEKYYYKLDFNYEELKKNYTFNETCQGTVPQAIYCFLISDSFEDAIRIGVSIGGDTDTLCSIVGAIAEAYYGIPNDIISRAIGYLDSYLQSKYRNFSKRFLTNFYNINRN